MPNLARIVALLILMPSLGCTSTQETLRIATYNIEDVRSADLTNPDHPRLARVAAVIRDIDADIILINEIASDQSEPNQTGPLQNGQRFANTFLAGDYTAVTLRSNTGIPTGHDLNNDGQIVSNHPPVAPMSADGSPPRQTADQRAYGSDAHGFGTFPGQYSMALLVKTGYSILSSGIHTFRLFKWSDLPNATNPTNLDGSTWYSPDEWADLRLSSKTHAIIPVRTPNGSIIHCIVSHPTPPAFDGPERRNKLRNRDEIRLLRAIIDAEPWLRDDKGQPITPSDVFNAVVMGDLNADPTDGSSEGDPIGHLLASENMAEDPTPRATRRIDGLDGTDTAKFGLRVDYVLPSRDLSTLRSGVWRPDPANAHAYPSDHFPVWADVKMPHSLRR
ncbi:MAG: endonuclease/exonuclease/phosphatase family protein [Phycisphaerales bacterium]